MKNLFMRIKAVSVMIDLLLKKSPLISSVILFSSASSLSLVYPRLRVPYMLFIRFLSLVVLSSLFCLGNLI